MGDLGNGLFIQRCARGRVDFATNGEVNVFVAERRGARLFMLIGGGFGVLARSQEPEEGHDGKVQHMAVCDSIFRVVEVKCFEEGTKDGDVDRLDSAGRLIFVAEAFEERSQ